MKIIVHNRQKHRAGRVIVHWWTLVGRNGKVLATSETYANARNARRAAVGVAKAFRIPIKFR